MGRKKREDRTSHADVDSRGGKEKVDIEILLRYYLLMWWRPRFFFSFQILLPIHCIGGGQGTVPEANDIRAKRGLLVPGAWWGVIVKYCARVLCRKQVLL